MKKFELIFNTIFSIFAYVIGGFDALFRSLLIVVTIDYFTGVIKAIYKKKYSNIINFKGILKKIGYMLIICLVTVLDSLMGNNSTALRAIVIYFFIANDAMSILENLAALGLPIPKRLQQVVESLMNDDDLP